MKVPSKKLLGIVAGELVAGSDYYTPIFIRVVKAVEESFDTLSAKDHTIEVHENKEVFTKFNTWIKAKLSEKGFRGVNYEVEFKLAGDKIWRDFGDK